MSYSTTKKAQGRRIEEAKLWFLRIISSLSGSLFITGAVQAVNSRGLTRMLWCLFYVLAGFFFFRTNQKAGEIMRISKHYIKGLQAAMIIIVVFGILSIALTELLLMY